MMGAYGMESAASKEEQGKEVEMVPATPDRYSLAQEEEGDGMAHPDSVKQHSASASEEVEAKIKELLSHAQALRARISPLLRPAGPHRVLTTGDVGWRCLAFVETEISFIASFLTTLKNQHLLAPNTFRWVNHCLEAVECNILRDIDSSSNHLLLRRAMQCFCRTNQERKGYYYTMIRELCGNISNYTCTSYLDLLHTSSYPEVTPLLAEAGALPLVGIDRPAKKLLRWLTPQGEMDKGLRVMSIVGPMGIGKTTLAVELHNRLIRHEPSSGGRYHFNCNVMAKASQGTDRNILLLQNILSQVSEAAATAWSSHPSETKTMEVLQRLVSECLQDKRYFVMIDDMWEASDWQEIKGAFPNNDIDSRILVTTRGMSTAWACCSGSYDGLVHEIEPLSKVDSERLLLARATGSVNGGLPNNMKLHYSDVILRCDGVPLFIIGIADWLKEQRLQQLHQREDEEEEHQRFTLHHKEQVPGLPEQLEQALSSAFNDFPNHSFRSLLLYMTMFPYGYKFERDRLILKWTHEGLIHHAAGYQEFTVQQAETSFSKLVDWNVITCVPSEYKHTNLDEADACQWQVNHFMQQFVASKSAEIGFIFTTATLNLVAAAAVTTTTTTDGGNKTSSRTPRRLALHHPDPLLPSLIESMDLSQTRSLAVSGEVSGIPLKRFVNLVVLDLEGWENLSDDDLLQVCRSKLFFLSYLSIRNTQVHKLPHEIKELRSLLTLDISYTRICELPLELFQLPYLKHLDLRGTWISDLPKQIVGLRNNLVDLLIGGAGSIYSAKMATRVPHSVQSLYRLQTLSTVDLTEQPASFVRDLGDLGNLRVITVTWSFHHSTDRAFCDALLSSIVKWQSLESLTIHCGVGCSMEFLGSLHAPWRLEKFKVTVGRFASVPRWIHVLEFLVFLQITVCTMQAMDDLNILGALPRLRCLMLGLDIFPGQAINIESERFRELQRFSICCPMPWLTFKTGAMPKLRYLQLKFRSAPASQICVPSGIINLRRLTEVALCYNAPYNNSPSVKMTVEAVTKQVAEHCNAIHLFINGIKQDDVQQVDDEVIEITIGTSSRTNAGAEDDSEADDKEVTAAAQCEITEVEG